MTHGLSYGGTKITRRREEMLWNSNRPIPNEEAVDIEGFIMWLYDGFFKFGKNQYADAVLCIMVKETIDQIRGGKKLVISIKQFYDEFRTKRDANECFTSEDAGRWLNIITKGEDIALRKPREIRKWYWRWPMPDEKAAEMKEFIVRLYDGFVKFGDNQYTDPVINIAVRHTTRQIGVRINTKLSQAAYELLGDCPDYTALERAQEKYPNKTVEEHVKPVKQFYDEFRAKRAAKEPFTPEDAGRWLKEAVIAIITQEEHNALANAGLKDDRTIEEYEKIVKGLTDFKCKRPF
jgi:hypothetical protein